MELLKAKKILKRLEEAVKMVEANLKQEAEKAASSRHHSLGPWKDHADQSGSVAECSKCGAWVEVTDSSHPKDTDINGPAIVIDCGYGWKSKTRTSRDIYR